MKDLQTLNRHQLGKPCWGIQLEFQWRNLYWTKCTQGWDLQEKEQRAVDKQHNQIGCLPSSSRNNWGTMANIVMLEFPLEGSRQNWHSLQRWYFLHSVGMFILQDKAQQPWLEAVCLLTLFFKDTLWFTFGPFSCSLSLFVKVWGWVASQSRGLGKHFT